MLHAGEWAEWGRIGGRATLARFGRTYWPFSNVYRYFGNVREGVCWYQKGSVDLALSEVPDKLVRVFVAIPNDADRYAGDLTHNAPYGGYKSFLEAIEEGGGIPHEWLRPCDLTIRELHEQKGRTEP